MFRELNIAEKRRFLAECSIAGLLCLCLVQAVFIYVVTVYVRAGLICNFAMLARVPSTSLNPTDLGALRLMASAVALLWLGPTLAAFPDRPWLSLLSLGYPWVMIAGLGLMSPMFPGELLARLSVGGAFISVGAAEWGLCAGVFYLLRWLGIFRLKPLYIQQL